MEFHDLSISLSFKYEQSIRQAGGIPFILPSTNDLALYVKRLPRAIRQTIKQTPDGGGRDLRELILIDEIFRQHRPLLTIGRGHQLLNVALGGTPITDIRRQIPDALNHQRLDQAGKIVQEAALTPGSLLAKITGRQVMGVNSSHHQAVWQAAEPLVATARSRDGIVEAMELKPATARRLLFYWLCSFTRSG